MKTLLFIDDDENLLHSYKRLFFQLRSQWDVVFEKDPLIARRLMEETPFDVIICDQLMPGIKGDKLLKEVSDRYPSTFTVLLSGEEKDYVPEESPWIRLFFQKPCHFDQIRKVLEEIYEP